MTSSQDDKKRPGVARGPTDSESVGLSTVPRRRIVVGGEAQAGSSNPPPDTGSKRAPASSAEAGWERRSSAPAHMRSRRERLPGTGYSEVPSHAEERVAPSAIPRAPRLPQIDTEKTELGSTAPGGAGSGGAGSGGAGSGGAAGAGSGSAGSGSASSGSASSSPATGGRTAVGVLGTGSRRAAEEASRSSQPLQQRGPLRRSDTARSVGNPILSEPGQPDSAPPEALAGVALSSAAFSGSAPSGSAPSGSAPSGSAPVGSPRQPESSSGTTAVGIPSVPPARSSDSGTLPPPFGAPAPPRQTAPKFEEFGPVTDANFPPVYSPSGTLQSMSAVRPELSDFVPAGKFKSTLTGAG